MTVPGTGTVRVQVRVRSTSKAASGIRKRLDRRLPGTRVPGTWQRYRAMERERLARHRLGRPIGPTPNRSNAALRRRASGAICFGCLSAPLRQVHRSPRAVGGRAVVAVMGGEYIKT